MNEQIEESEENGHSIGAEQAPLVTRRLTLRTPHPRDAGAIVPLANNMRIAQQTRRMPHPYTLKDAEGWIAAVRGAQPRREAAFLILRRNDDTLMGGAGYAAMEEDGEVEIGYWLGSPIGARAMPPKRLRRSSTMPSPKANSNAFTAAAGWLTRPRGGCWKSAASSMRAAACAPAGR